MSSVSAHTFVILLLTTWGAIFLAHYAVAMEPSMTTDTFLENLDDKNQANNLLLHKRGSFFVGSRYGRSGGNAGNTMKARRLNVVPRNDRFFLGSRYGKRSSEFAAPIIFDEETNNAPDAPDFNQLKINNNNDSKNKNLMMSCFYTGVKNLYRCNNMNEIKNILNQFTDTQNDYVEKEQQQQLQERQQ